MTVHPNALVRSAIVRAAAVVVAAYAAAAGSERLVIHATSANSGELLWVSDLVLSITVGIVVYLQVRLRDTQTTVSRLELEQVVVNTQLAVAADIQHRALPALPPPQDGFEWAARLEPAGKIGGDFYDFVHVGEDVVLMLVGDISGKGIPAALLLALTRAVFRASARDTQDPATVIGRLSRALFDDTQGSPYATCFVAAFHLREGTLTYANAGHPAPLVIEPTGRRLLDAGGPPAGMFPHWSYDSTTITLQPASVGIVVTDGVTEALESHDRRPFDAIETAARALGTASAEATCDRIMQLAANGSGPEGVDGWQDDRTVVVFRVGAAHRAP